MGFWTFATLAVLLLVPSPATGNGTRQQDSIRTAIVAAVSERLGPVSNVDVQIVVAPVAPTGQLVAKPAPGARLGRPIRFVMSPQQGRRFNVVARVSVVAGHVVAARPLARDQEIAPQDVEWKEGRIDGELLEAPPTLEHVLDGRPRRAIAAGEMVSRTLLARKFAVRAGDQVSVTIREGAIEAHGVGRAVSSGSIGDVIRITRPGSREIRRARIIAPAAVEIQP